MNSTCSPSIATACLPCRQVQRFEHPVKRLIVVEEDTALPLTGSVPAQEKLGKVHQKRTAHDQYRASREVLLALQQLTHTRPPIRSQGRFGKVEIVEREERAIGGPAIERLLQRSNHGIDDGPREITECNDNRLVILDPLDMES